jgi:hypothetical protein
LCSLEEAIECHKLLCHKTAGLNQAGATARAIHEEEDANGLAQTPSTSAHSTQSDTGGGGAGAGGGNSGGGRLLRENAFRWTDAEAHEACAGVGAGEQAHCRAASALWHASCAHAAEAPSACATPRSASAAEAPSLPCPSGAHRGDREQLLLDHGAIERMVKSSLGDVDVDTYAHAQDELYSDSSDDDDEQADHDHDHDHQLSLIQLQLKVLNPKP